MQDDTLEDKLASYCFSYNCIIVPVAPKTRPANERPACRMHAILAFVSFNKMGGGARGCGGPAPHKPAAGIAGGSVLIRCRQSVSNNSDGGSRVNLHQGHELETLCKGRAQL